MVNAHNLAARVAANIFVWSILSFGLVFLLVFQDYGVGFELSILAACETPTTSCLFWRCLAKSFSQRSGFISFISS